MAEGEFVVKYINRDGEAVLTSHYPLTAVEEIKEKIARNLEELKTLPPECKIEISYKPPKEN